MEVICGEMIYFCNFSALSPQMSDNDQQSGSVSLPVPPCMSESSYKRLTINNPMKPEELEEVYLFFYFTK